MQMCIKGKADEPAPLVYLYADVYKGRIVGTLFSFVLPLADVY